MHMCVHIHITLHVRKQLEEVGPLPSRCGQWRRNSGLSALAANVLTQLAGSWRVLQDELSSKTSHLSPINTLLLFGVSLLSLGALRNIVESTMTNINILRYSQFGMGIYRPGE